jgi:GGDEF domain-containing protein
VAHDELDLSLDLLAGLLRTWARNPIELPLREAEIIAAELEAWAAHLLNGSPPPGSKARGKLKERDWPGAQQFIARLRRDEATAVRGAASDFRATLQALVTKVREAIEEERELDSTVALQLDRLRAAAEGNDLQALREAATSAADAVSTVLDAHRTRLAEQEQQMSSRLLAIGEKLTAAEQLAEEDPLTGLVNRRGFDAELAKAVELGARFKMVSALLLIDVDHFKSVNDTFGHQAVILRDLRSGEAAPLARRFLEALRSLPVHPLETEIRISASIGIAELKAGESSASWVARADAGVYAAKSGGRDQAALTP